MNCGYKNNATTTTATTTTTTNTFSEENQSQNDELSFIFFNHKHSIPIRKFLVLLATRNNFR